MYSVVHREEDLPRLKRCVINIIASRSQTLADSDYSYLLCTTDLVVELSKPVVVRHPPPYFTHNKIWGKIDSEYVMTRFASSAPAALLGQRGPRGLSSPRDWRCNSGVLTEGVW